MLVLVDRMVGQLQGSKSRMQKKKPEADHISGIYSETRNWDEWTTKQAACRRYYRQIRCHCNCSTGCGSNRFSSMATVSNPGTARAHPVCSESTIKHVHRAYDWIGSHAEGGDIAVLHVSENATPAYIFMTALGRASLRSFVKCLACIESIAVVFSDFCAIQCFVLGPILVSCVCLSCLVLVRTLKEFVFAPLCFIFLVFAHLFVCLPLIVV